MNIPLSLRKGFAHLDMGVFLRALDGGTVETGAEISLP